MFCGWRNFLVRFTFLSLLAPIAWAQAPGPDAKVIKLRAEQVTLTSADKGKNATERVFQRSSFSAPWPIRSENVEDGTLIVEVEGKPYKVAGMDVVTNAVRTAQSCVDKKAVKVGGTRGVQDPLPCK